MLGNVARPRRAAAAVGVLVGLAGLALGSCSSAPGDPAATGFPSVAPTPDRTDTTDGEVPAELTIVLDETGSGDARTFTLTCGPPGGEHPGPEEACAALVDAGADAFATPPADQMCTEVYGGPQVATVEGTVGGQRVSARFTRTNGCEISRWDALAPLLGSSDGLL